MLNYQRVINPKNSYNRAQGVPRHWGRIFWMEINSQKSEKCVVNFRGLKF